MARDCRTEYRSAVGDMINILDVPVGKDVDFRRCFCRLKFSPRQRIQRLNLELLIPEPMINFQGRSSGQRKSQSEPAHNCSINMHCCECNDHNNQSWRDSAQFEDGHKRNIQDQGDEQDGNCDNPFHGCVPCESLTTSSPTILGSTAGRTMTSPRSGCVSLRLISTTTPRRIP